MSGFGGYCPLPLRLGGGDTDGWTAEQHARASADLSAVVKTAGQALLTVSKIGAAITLASFSGVNGLGPTYAPVLASGGTGIVTVTFPTVLEDEYGAVDTVEIYNAEGTGKGATPIIVVPTLTSPNVVTVRTFNTAGTLTDAAFTLEVGCWSRRTRMGEYDAATDKTNTVREQEPYAASAYQELTEALGSAFTTAKNSIVHARKLARARISAAKRRSAEAINANSRPDTADTFLGEWVKILQLRFSPDDTRHEIRQRAAAKFQASLGNSPGIVDAVVADLLGPAFSSVLRATSSPLTSPPTPTYWPTINPGPPGYDVGGGAWMSARCNITVLTQRPYDVTDSAFRRLVDVELVEELGRLLPAWVTFGWSSVSPVGGFLLDISAMDFDTFDI
jgi:hypothetical protein